jgi:CxxC motif-containing protein
VGLIPENELSLGAGVQLDTRAKGAVIDEHYQTRVAGMFAACKRGYDYVEQELTNPQRNIASKWRLITHDHVN